MKGNFRCGPTTGQRKDLQALGERLGLPPSELIRLAIRALLAHTSRNGGRVLLPLDYDEVFKEGRRRIKARLLRRRV